MTILIITLALITLGLHVIRTKQRIDTDIEHLRLQLLLREGTQQHDHHR